MKLKNKITLIGLCALSLGFMASCSTTTPVNDETRDVDKTPAATVVIEGTNKIEVGGETQLSLKMSEVERSSFVWESSDTKVATVKDGRVIGIAPGTVTIKATSIEDLTLEASYEVTVVKDLDGKYKVSFVDYDGTLLYETYVEEGGTATYKGNEPTRLNSASVLYKFIGWDKDLTDISANTVIKAVYSESDFGDYFFENIGTTYKFIGYSGEDETLVIPTSFNGIAVTSIGSKVLAGNTFVKKIVIPQGIDTIEANAFEATENLEEVTIPNSVYTFGDKIFYNCKKLTTVTIEEGVNKLSSGMFQACEAIKNIELPDTLTEIGENCFFMSGLEEITIPENITMIGASAFSNCSNLVSATIKANITDLPSSLFSSCKNLATINFEGNVTSLGMAFAMSCVALTSVTFPDTLTTVGDRAFSGCTALETITIGKETSDFGEDSFKNVPALNDGGSGIKFKEDDTTHKIEDGILYSKDGTKITYVLDKTVVPTTLNFKELGVVEIGSYAFLDTKTITAIDLDGVKSIGAHAFDGCSGVTGELVIPESCVDVGLGAFEYMSKITSIDIQTLFGESKTIPEEIFRNCTSVTTAHIPSGITTISLRAFGWMGNKFTSVNIPKSVTYIGNYAFQSNKKLIITYEGTEEEWKNVVLDGTYAIPSAQLKTMVFAGEGE